MYLDKDDNLYGFCLEGHAEAAPYGQDLVCSAISMLAITVANSLSEQLSVEPKLESDDQRGYLECVLQPGLSAEEKICAQAILKTLELGLNSLEDNYGQYIKVKKRRWK